MPLSTKGKGGGVKGGGREFYLIWGLRKRSRAAAPIVRSACLRIAVILSTPLFLQFMICLWRSMSEFLHSPRPG